MAIDLNNVLVTGAEGMVGSYVDFGIRADRRLLDVTDLKEMLALCEREQPSAILHLAAETDVDRCERDPEHAYMVNGIGAYHAATAAKKMGIKLVYISTAGIFDGKKEGPYTESDEGNPPNYYGRSKYMGELAVKGMLTDYIVARVCWMFGGGPEKDQKFVAKIIRQLDKPEIKAVNDAIGSPTSGKDLIAAIKKLLAQDARGVINLANTGTCSRYEVAQEIASILAPKVTVTPVSSSFFNLDAPRVLNEGLISRADLMRPWKEALREYLETEWSAFRKS